jgi:hypothetical protein
MRTLILIFLLAGSARAQQLFTPQNESPPREAESILIASCRVVGERFSIPLPEPKVELRTGEKANSIETVENRHVIHLKHWDKALFKVAALHVCMRSAELALVHSMVKNVRDY